MASQVSSSPIFKRFCDFSIELGNMTLVWGGVNCLLLSYAAVMQMIPVKVLCLFKVVYSVIKQLLKLAVS